MPDKTISDLLAAIVRKHYIELPQFVTTEGAQMWNGEWWMPLSGCDTLSNMLDDLDYAIERREKTK